MSDPNDPNKPDLTLAVDNTTDEAELSAEEEAQAYASADLHGHKFSGKALLDAVDILDRGSTDPFPANELKDVGMKLSILGMAESHVRRLNRLDRAMNMIEQQLATPDRLAQMTSSELAKLYRMLGASMDVSQRYVKDSMWSVNIGELQDQLTELSAGASSSSGEDSDHSTREVVTDIFRRVSTLGKNFPEPQDGTVPDVNPDHLPNDLLQEEQRQANEEQRQASNQAMLDEARDEYQKANRGAPAASEEPPTNNTSAPDSAPAEAAAPEAASEGQPTAAVDNGGHGFPAAGLSRQEWDDVMEEELGASAPLNLNTVKPATGEASWNDDSLETGEDDEELLSDWGDDSLGGKDDPLAGIDLNL